MSKTKKKIGEISEVLKEQVFKLISDPHIRTWKSYIKDANLHSWNILVEAFDNGIDAGAKNITARFEMFQNKNIKKLGLFDDGTGILDHDVDTRFTEFPLTRFTYKDNSLGANGYGIKGIAMRLGGVSKLLTKTKEEELYRLYEFYFIDTDGNRYKPNELYKISTGHDKFFEYKFIQDDIVGIEIIKTTISNEECKNISLELANVSAGTYIEIQGTEDNGLEVNAETQEIIKKYIQAFYGLMDINISIGFDSDNYTQIKPIRFPLETAGYPSLFKQLDKFEDIKVTASKNEYYGYIFYTFSEKHQGKELDRYKTNVLPFERIVPYINGNKARNDGQYIWIYNEHKRLIGIYRLNENGQFYGNDKYNHLNIVLVAKTKIKNLDRLKFLGFSSDKEIREIRENIKSILDLDDNGDSNFISPTYDMGHVEELTQTQELVSNIIEGHNKYRERAFEYIFDKLTHKPITSDVKNTSNWNVTNNVKIGNQIDIECFKILWEIENKDSVSSKDHLEKLNLWYDEIIQMANLDYEWIVWIAKSHSFEKRLTTLMKKKPCTNPNFKGFILMDWKDFYRENEKEIKVKYVEVTKSEK